MADTFLKKSLMIISTKTPISTQTNRLPSWTEHSM